MVGRIDGFSSPRTHSVLSLGLAHTTYAVAPVIVRQTAQCAAMAALLSMRDSVTVPIELTRAEPAPWQLALL